MGREDRMVEHGGKLYRWSESSGYRMLHPVVDGVTDFNTSVMEHRLVYELAHGVKLDSNTIVHHLNKNRSDNRPENLIAMSRSDHAKLHAYEKSGSPDMRPSPYTEKNATKKFKEMLSKVVAYGDTVYCKTVFNGYYILYPIVDGSVDYTSGVLEHRLVYELENNRTLAKNDYVHHINHDKLDNRPENLEVLSPSEHMRRHALENGRTLHEKSRCVDCGKEISRGATRCLECRKEYVKKAFPSKIDENGITKERLQEMIETMNNSEIARMCDVSDTAVKKWRIKFGLPSANEQHGWHRGPR